MSMAIGIGMSPVLGGEILAVETGLTDDQFQGVFGEFKPVVDTARTPSDNNFQGVFGEFKPVIDEAA